MLKKIQQTLVEKGPELLSHPLAMIPFDIKKRVIQQLLQEVFKQSLEEGELDFLEDRWLKIEVRDLNLIWYVSNIDEQLVVSRCEIPDVTFIGNTNDLILIATRRQDPDTLFFQRRLVVEGDTELGLHIKNLMDSIDLESMPKMVTTVLESLADVIEKN